jgi:hypothetical protein
MLSSSSSWVSPFSLELNEDDTDKEMADCRDEAHKYDVLVELYNLLTIGQSIIFVKVRLPLPSPLSLLTPALPRNETQQTRLPNV